MSAILVFPTERARPAQNPESAYIAQAGRPVDVRSLAVRTAVRGYCHNCRFEASITGRATMAALTQVSNGQTTEFAINYGCTLADRLSQGAG